MITSTIQQRTPDWFRARLGKITGSAVGNIISKGKGADFTKTGLTYLNGVVAERILQPDIIADDDFFQTYLDEVNTTSKAMRIGTEREQEARELYAAVRNEQVEEAGSVEHPDIRGFASSPDGVIADGVVKGVLEIKCPTPATYVNYLSAIQTAEDLKAVNSDYYWQCYSHMAVTGAAWCDFVAYCPYLKVPLHIVRINRDEEVISQLLERVRLALQYIDATALNALKSLLELPESPRPSELEETPTQSEQLEPDSEIRISKADLIFLAETLLPKLIEAFPIEKDDIRAENLIRRGKLLLNKLTTKLNKIKR